MRFLFSLLLLLLFPSSAKEKRRGFPFEQAGRQTGKRPTGWLNCWKLSLLFAGRLAVVVSVMPTLSHQHHRQVLARPYLDCKKDSFIQPASQLSIHPSIYPSIHSPSPGSHQLRGIPGACCACARDARALCEQRAPANR